MKYIRTKDGRIIDIEAFINKEKENPYYSDYEFEEIKNDEIRGRGAFRISFIN